MSSAACDDDIVPELGLWDAVSIIIGIVVGTAIFRSPGTVFSNTSSVASALGAWGFGGALSLCGAFCYAELATTYPRDGGDYEYLSRAFGRWFGFLFGWTQITVVISANIGIMAYALADYAAHVWPLLEGFQALVAIVPVAALTWANVAGTVAGKRTQNLLTLAKVVGITAVVFAGIGVGLLGQRSKADLDDAGIAALNAPAETSFGLAMVFVLYAYGGWNHAAFVAAEVRDRSRDLPRALLIGIAAIVAIYLAVNAAYVMALGHSGVSRSQTPAADVMDQAVGTWGATAISLIVMVSSLGAMNGMILTASRIYAVWGADAPRLAWLAGWSRTGAAPVAAVVAQGVMTIALIALVGTTRGRGLFDGLLGWVGLDGLPWERHAGGFETLVVGTAPVFWTFFLLTGAAMIVLRLRDRDRPRPFKAPLFPLPPLILCATSGFMLYASLSYAGWLSLLGFVPLAMGVPAYYLAHRT